MGWLWLVLGVVVGLPLVVFAIGSALPRDHVARMAIELKSPPERVWTLVSDVGGTARWRSDVTEIEVQPISGGLARYVETSKHGKIPFEVVSREAPRRQVVRVVDDDQPFGARGHGRLSPWDWGPGSSSPKPGSSRARSSA